MYIGVGHFKHYIGWRRRGGGEGGGEIGSRRKEMHSGRTLSLLVANALRLTYFEGGVFASVVKCIHLFTSSTISPNNFLFRSLLFSNVFSLSVLLHIVYWLLRERRRAAVRICDAESGGRSHFFRIGLEIANSWHSKERLMWWMGVRFTTVLLHLVIAVSPLSEGSS